MENAYYQNVKTVLSRHINENTRVLDLLGGENIYSSWLSSNDKAQVIPLSPDVLGHVKSENPFVAYNNFINDSRLLPTTGGKADLVILVGPLYTMQSTKRRVETLKEVKRLLSENGKVVTVCDKNYLSPIIPSVRAKSEKEAKKLLRKCELENAGFEINSITELPKTEAPDKRLGKYIAVASIKTVPDPAVFAHMIPPVVHLPKRNIVVQKDNSGLVTYYKEPFAPTGSENITVIKTEPDEKIDYRTVRQSIHPYLQFRIVKPVFPSIDNNIQPNSFVTEETTAEGYYRSSPSYLSDIQTAYIKSQIRKEAFAKIKPAKLLQNIGGKDIFKSINGKLQEKKRPPVAVSIDDTLQGCYRQEPVFISMADIDISKAEHRLAEIRHRLPIIPKEILDSYIHDEPDIHESENKTEKTDPMPTAAMPEILNDEKKIYKSIDKTLTEKKSPEVKKSIDNTLQGEYKENAEELLEPDKKQHSLILPKEILDSYKEDKQNTSEEKTKPEQRKMPPPSENFGLNIMPSIDKNLIFRKNRSKLTSEIKKSIDKNLVIRKDKEKIMEKFRKELEQKQKNAKLRKVHQSIDNRLNKRTSTKKSEIQSKRKGKNLNKN